MQGKTKDTNDLANARQMASRKSNSDCKNGFEPISKHTNSKRLNIFTSKSVYFFNRFGLCQRVFYVQMYQENFGQSFTTRSSTYSMRSMISSWCACFLSVWVSGRLVFLFPHFLNTHIHLPVKYLPIDIVIIKLFIFFIVVVQYYEMVVLWQMQITVIFSAITVVSSMHCALWNLLFVFFSFLSIIHSYLQCFVLFCFWSSRSKKKNIDVWKE